MASGCACGWAKCGGFSSGLLDARQVLSSLSGSSTCGSFTKESVEHDSFLLREVQKKKKKRRKQKNKILQVDQNLTTHQTSFNDKGLFVYFKERKKRTPNRRTRIESCSCAKALFFFALEEEGYTAGMISGCVCFTSWQVGNDKEFLVSDVSSKKKNQLKLLLFSLCTTFSVLPHTTSSFWFIFWFSSCLFVVHCLLPLRALLSLHVSRLQVFASSLLNAGVGGRLRRHTINSECRR